MTAENPQGSFWDHLDILRAAIIRIIAVWGIFSIVAFVFKEQLFEFVLAPRNNDFVTYRFIGELCCNMGIEEPKPFSIQLINTGLAQQFIIHMKTALCAGIILVAPYALYQIFGFISPGLYCNERKYTSRLIISGYLMFLIGTSISYLVIFPMTFRFLGTYQVAGDVVNMISLESYMGTLIIMCLCMGIVCELPVLSWICARMGLISAPFMAKYRKHAIIVILIVAAIITPTSDIFTLILVSVPIWLLYEVSLLIVKRVSRNTMTTI